MLSITVEPESYWSVIEYLENYPDYGDGETLKKGDLSIEMSALTSATLAQDIFDTILLYDVWNSLDDFVALEYNFLNFGKLHPKLINSILALFKFGRSKGCYGVEHNQVSLTWLDVNGKTCSISLDEMD